MTFNHERAIKDYTELQRLISVGAYSERSAEDFANGTYPEDGVEESIDNLTELAARDDLEFHWHEGTRTYTLEPMSEETRVARNQALQYDGNDSDVTQEPTEEDEEIEDESHDLHQCAYCYNLVNSGHEEFCRLNPQRNREIVP